MTRRNWITGLLALLTTARAPAQAPDPMEQRMREVRAKLRAAFPYPITTVPGAQALTAWKRIRAESKGWPVIVGGDEGLDAICDQFSMDTPSVLTPGATDFPVPTPAQTIAASRTLAVPDALFAPAEHDGNPPPPTGAWPDRPGQETMTVATDLLSGKPFAKVHIVTLPTALSWEVPAYLRWGGWNACPSADVHCAAMRDWQERYGAELVGIDRDTINLRVKRRPKDRAEALALARACYAYCPDTIDQGVGTLEALATTLMGSDWWFFWWD